jgi:hypothetical protein
MTPYAAMRMKRASAAAGSVNVLMHMDGTNGGTTFTEDNGKTPTRVGSGIVTSTTQAKFGTASATGFASGSTLRVAASAMPADFTLAAWFWWDGTAAGNKAIFTTNGGSELYIRNSSSNALTWFTAGSNVIIGSGGAPSANAWHLACMERVGTTVRMTLDGVSQGTYTDSGTFIAGDLYIGSYSSGAENFTGYIDDVYLRIGNALFGGGAFTPPTSAFTL